MTDLKVDLIKILTYLKSPVIILLVWLAVDRTIVYLRKSSWFLRESVIIGKGEIEPGTWRDAIRKRIKTFRSLVFQTVRIIVALFFTLRLLKAFNVNLAPVLAGIGVVGLGLSLAAQNLMRDFLNGIFIVIENQFDVGDWVEIGAHSGSVEAFTLRTTRLRSTNGSYIIIPNSTIQTVVNCTKLWSVAYVELGISYREHIPEVLSTVEACCEELYNMHSSLILEKSKIQAISDFRPNGMMLRVLTKTTAGGQWEVERALRILVKERFDKLNIDISLPQMVLRESPDKE